MTAPRMVSVQFHLESVISPDGAGLLAEVVDRLCRPPHTALMATG